MFLFLLKSSLFGFSTHFCLSVPDSLSFAKLSSLYWCVRCFRGLELSYEGVQARGSTLFIKSVTAKGSVPSSAGKVGAAFMLKLRIVSLEKGVALIEQLLPHL